MRLYSSFDKLKTAVESESWLSFSFFAQLWDEDILVKSQSKIFKPVKPDNKIGTIDHRAVMTSFFRSYKGKSKTMYSNKHSETFNAVE